MHTTKSPIPFTLGPRPMLSPCSQSVAPEDVPTIRAMLKAQGWEQLPTVGPLEYARFTRHEAGSIQAQTVILYASGLLLTIPGRRGGV